MRKKDYKYEDVGTNTQRRMYLRQQEEGGSSRDRENKGQSRVHSLKRTGRVISDWTQNRLTFIVVVERFIFYIKPTRSRS